jgi:hypothetical protein
MVVVVDLVVASQRGVITLTVLVVVVQVVVVVVVVVVVGVGIAAHQRIREISVSFVQANI